MKARMKRIRISLFFTLIASVPVAGQDARPTVTVAAASDLYGLADPLKRAFSSWNLTFSFGSSGLLARQIEAGAPFDVFLSANEEFVSQLVAKRLIAREDVQIYANGRIALWSKSGAIQSLDDFAKFGQLRISIANPGHAPYGLAAKQALEKTGWWQKLEGRVVFGENVRQALQFAESGNVDATITAWSLVHDKNGTLLAGDLHAPLRQVGAELRKSKRRKEGRQLMEFLMSREGRNMLTENGFFVPAYAPSLKGK
jgi:molybdate transport system substrate-binding protein